MIPVGDISWRTAAILCNWLHNDRALTREAFLGGAYEVSTFGFATGGFSDQISHSAGARFWIPTHDQWLAAAHYDPSRVDPSTAQPGSYWQYSTTSDTAPIYEPPENGGQANAGFNRGGRAYSIALGDYPTVQSPWGLLDTAGGSSEWTEEVVYQTGQPNPGARLFEGSARNDTPIGIDVIGGWGGTWPGFPDGSYGLRLAAAIPSAGASGLLVFTSCMFVRRRRACGADFVVVGFLVKEVGMKLHRRGVCYGLLALLTAAQCAWAQTGVIRVERKIGTGAWTLLGDQAGDTEVSERGW